jgi:hypothetical protein
MRFPKLFFFGRRNLKAPTPAPMPPPRRATSIGGTDATPKRKLKSVWAASAEAADLLWRRLRIGQRW